MVVLRGTTQSTVTPLEIMFIRRLWWTPMWNFLFKKIRTWSEANNLALESLWKGKRFDWQDIFDWLLLIGLLVTLIIIFILWKTKDQMLLGRLLSLCVCVLTCGLSQTSQLQVDISSPPPFFVITLPSVFAKMSDRFAMCGVTPSRVPEKQNSFTKGANHSATE